MDLTMEAVDLISSIIVGHPIPTCLDELFVGAVDDLFKALSNSKVLDFLLPNLSLSASRSA